jgi:hypothetical protein
MDTFTCSTFVFEKMATSFLGSPAEALGWFQQVTICLYMNSYTSEVEYHISGVCFLCLLRAGLQHATIGSRSCNSAAH